MILQSLKSSDRSWMWYAQDYSEGTLEKELFAIKFKNPDEVFTKSFLILLIIIILFIYLVIP